MSWTQAQCERCWVERNTAANGSVRQPTRMAGEHVTLERCAWCGLATFAGIYVRADPATLPYAAQD
jgi:hypothetical protein